MKCLVIHGSPRRGNTWNVLNIVKDEMQKSGDFTFDVIELAKEKIPTCLGCFNCIERGEDKCPHKSFIEPIVKKMEEADAFIITSPVYSMQVTGLLKTFLDHMSFNFHRPRFYKKKVMIITTTAGAGHKDAANYLKEVMYYWGVNHVQTLSIAYRSYDLSEKNKDKAIKAARSFGKELNSNVLHEPSFKSIIMYNLWKGLSLSGDGKLKADNEYWNKTELKDRYFFPGIPIGFMKKATGKMFSIMMRPKN